MFLSIITGHLLVNRVSYRYKMSDNGGNGNDNSNNNLSETSLAFIGASVTLVLAIIIIILLIISFRLCLKVVQRRYLVQTQLHNANSGNPEGQQNTEEDPNLPSFNWRHSLRIAGTLPPSYEEAKELPSLDDTIPPKEDNQDTKIEDSLTSKDDKKSSDVCLDIIEDSTKGEAANPATDVNSAIPAAPTSDTVITVEPNEVLMNTLNPHSS